MVRGFMLLNGRPSKSSAVHPEFEMKNAASGNDFVGGRMRVAVVGGGPAGLRAAEVAAAGGAVVSLWDRKPSVGRKFLVAGRGGLNLTKDEPVDVFARHYLSTGQTDHFWHALVREFGPEETRSWALGLGVETFVASTRRVYPKEMRAAPLLRRWVERLRASGVAFHMRHELRGISRDGELGLEFSRGDSTTVRAGVDALILAMGGASWPDTGSDGCWVQMLRGLGVDVAELQPANCGWEWNLDSEFAEQWQGTPIKSVHVCAGGEQAKGELLVTKYGLEGGAIYQLGARLRAMSEPCITVDFKPQSTVEQLLGKMGPIQRNFLSEAEARWRLPGVVAALLRKRIGTEDLASARELASIVKEFQIRLKSPRNIAEAISSAGGVKFCGLDSDLMLASSPGIFVAGEMIDWEAPTGGYPLQGCLATGTRAARGALNWLKAR